MNNWNGVGMMKTIYEVDESTQKVIDSLRSELKLSSNADVLRRALTLLKLASDAAKIGNVTTIGGLEVSL